MPYFLSPIGNSQILDANGDPLVGGTIETYLAGTSTAATTYTDDTGGTSHGSTITLNSLGRPTLGPVWMLGGVPLKFIIKNASGVVQPPTFDDISGVGDTATAPDQFPFIASTPTYISASSFSVVGDQTNTFQIGRRLKTVNSGGTVYGTVTASSFAAGVTTVVMLADSGTLDSGLSQVNYGLLSATSDAMPRGIFPTIPQIAGYLFGLTMSTAGSSATMSVAAGVCTNSTSAAVMTLTAIAKTTSAWAVGTAQGGLDTGAVAINSWYHFFVIRRPDTGVVDVLFSLSPTAPTLPANYTQFRRIGSGRTNASSQWVQFQQDGDYFEWFTPVLDVNTANPGTSAVTSTLTVPTGVVVTAKFNGGINNGGAAVFPYIYFSALDSADLSPSGTVAPLAVSNFSTNGAGGSEYSYSTQSIKTNTSAQIRYRLNASNASCTVRIAILGWVDTRGRAA